VAARRMAELGVRHLPVVDGHHLVGMLSMRDVMAGRRSRRLRPAELVSRGPDGSIRPRPCGKAEQANRADEGG
jgi:CBS domain-containing protein